MENQDSSKPKVIFIKKAPTRKDFDSISKMKINFGLDDDGPGDGFPHVCYLPDGTEVKINPNSKLTWQELYKSIQNT